MMVILNKVEGRNTTKVKFGETNSGISIPYISSNALEATGIVINGFSTRFGGVSEEFLASMNLGYSRGDLEENVLENHRRMADALRFDYKKIVASDQTHTTNIRVVTKEDCGKGIIRPRDYSNIDGLITNEPSIPLATYYADCIPLFMVDVKNKSIGLSHSGWKGTVNKIGLKTIKVMSQKYGTNPEDVICFVGPSICQKCYEISKDVAEKFQTAFPQNINDILIDKDNEKYQLNLWESVKLVFKEAGVLEENISITDICTCCNMDSLFSHRGHNGKRGNMAAFLMLKGRSPF